MLESWGLMGTPSSNNEAEYSGILAVAQHALVLQHPRVVFQTDSLLVANQVNCIWACRSKLLQPLLSQTWNVLHALENLGSHIIVEHIYREHNRHADRLANHSLDTQCSAAWAVASITQQ